MRGQVNMNGVQEQSGGFESCPLPDEGEYYVEIVAVKEKFSKAGDAMPSIKLKITSGLFQDSWLWDNILIPDSNGPAAKILGRTKHFLHCIGELYESENVEWDTENWIEKTCKIRLQHEPPNEYHKNARAVVAEYILEETIEDSPL